MTLSTDDKNYLVLGCLGEYIDLCEQDGDEYNVPELLEKYQSMTDSKLIDEAETSLTPKEFYNLWSNYIPNEFNNIEN